MQGTSNNTLSLFEKDNQSEIPRPNEIKGIVRSLHPSSKPDGSWVMGHVELLQGGRAQIIAFGVPGFQVGLEVFAKGEWERDPTHGKQFKVRVAEFKLPQGNSGVVRYISENIPHCGPSRARKIVDVLGADTLEILSSEPHRVLGIFKGKMGEKIHQGWVEWSERYVSGKKRERLLARLLQLDLSLSLSRRILEFFKDPKVAEKILLQDPYRLVEVPGVGFKTADSVAGKLGIKAADERRLRAGLVFTLTTAQAGGDVGLPESLLVGRAKRQLGVRNQKGLTGILHSLLEEGTLIRDGELLYTPYALKLEKNVTSKLKRFLAQKTELSDSHMLRVKNILKESGLSFTQQKAVVGALRNAVFVLTGRPGSGKTTTTKTFVKCCSALGLKVEIAAPTGKAANRAGEVIGREAKTIHRLLGGFPGQKRAEPVDADVIVLDETSMTDLEVFSWLLDSVDPRRTRLFLVGDQNQLPSVGFGQVFKDLIESGRIPYVNLKEIFRQGRESLIVTNAHKLLDGQTMDLSTEMNKDFVFADVTLPEAVGADGFPVHESEHSQNEQKWAVERMKKAVQYLTKAHSINPQEDLQVLAPMRKGTLGIENLNGVLTDMINPHGQVGPFIEGHTRVKVGDRVIQTKNNYSIEGGLFNGEQGVVREISGENRNAIRVDFGDKIVELSGDQLKDLYTSWAITVHRSQGSEYPYVLLLYHTAHHVMLSLPLLYTAMTRAKTQFILIGNKKALATTWQRGKQNATARYSQLADRLRNLPAA